MPESREPRRFLRTRDLFGFLAVLLMGAALIYTALSREASTASLSLAAFLLAGLLLLTGYGGAYFLDRLSQKYRALSSKKHRPIVLGGPIVLAIVGGVLFVREPKRAMAGIRETTAQVVDFVDRQRAHFGLPGPENSAPTAQKSSHAR